MFERVQRTITIAVLAGYLLMVTAGPQVHRCQLDHASSSRAPASEACAHCHTLRGESSGRTLEAGIASSCAIVAGAASEHREGDCFVCQMLAQKYVAGRRARPAILWAEVAHVAPVAETRAAARHSCSLGTFVPLPASRELRHAFFVGRSLRVAAQLRKRFSARAFSGEGLPLCSRDVLGLR